MLKLHEDANVEINDHQNGLYDVNKFSNHISTEINITNAKQFKNIIYTANKGRFKDKIYILKTRNHFDVIKSLTAFYDCPYYCHERKKAYTRRDKHKCPSKCLSWFTFIKGKKCEGKEIICKNCNRKFFGEKFLRITLRTDLQCKTESKTNSVCESVRKCTDCERIITGKYVKIHKCGYKESDNCDKYVNKDHGCFLKKVKAKGGHCTVNKDKPCKTNESMKRKIGATAVKCTRKNINSTILKLLKILVFMRSILLSHKVLKVTNTFIRVSMIL